MIEQLDLVHRRHLNKYSQSGSEVVWELWQWTGTTPSPKLEDLNLTIRISLLLYPWTQVMRGSLDLCRSKYGNVWIDYFSTQCWYGMSKFKHNSLTIIYWNDFRRWLELYVHIKRMWILPNEENAIPKYFKLGALIEPFLLASPGS